MKIKGDWNIFHIFISGLVTAIFINYLATGFIDIVVNIDNLLTWLQKSEASTVINQLIQQVFR